VGDLVCDTSDSLGSYGLRILLCDFYDCRDTLKLDATNMIQDQTFYVDPQNTNLERPQNPLDEATYYNLYNSTGAALGPHS
jgi:hypothetical protein